MKTLGFLLTLLMLASQVAGQRNQKVDPKDAQIDSLKQVSANLTLQLDSVKGELVKYLGVYDAIKEKILFYDFDPTRSAYLIDSLKAVRDSSSALIQTLPDSLSSSTADSLKLLVNENTVLKGTIDSLKLTWESEKISMSSEEIDKAKAISTLKQLKELLDNKIITEAEFLALKQKYLSKL